MKIETITSCLELLAPLACQEDYDNAGLLTGDSDMECTGALMCLDINTEVMNEAIGKKCNLVISHHPFIFRGIKKLTGNQPETEVLTRAIKNDIAIYAIHTNLDNSLNGLNARVLSMIGASEFRILSPMQDTLRKLAVFVPEVHADSVRQAMFDAGAGHIGNYDQCSFNIRGTGSFRASRGANPFVGEIDRLHFENEVRVEVVVPAFLQQAVINSLVKAHPYEEVAYDLYPLKNDLPSYGAGLMGRLKEPMPPDVFLHHLKTSLQLPLIRHTTPPLKSIRNVAICTGAGGFLIPKALRSGMDAFLTADLKYHDFFIPSQNMLLADIGHYESEHFVKEWLRDVLIEKFPNFAFFISSVDTNPINYL